VVRLAAALAAMLLALSAAGAHAQRDPRSEREARSLFEDGLEAAEQERWADALELFRRSRSVVPRPSVLYNEAQVLVRLGRFVEARTALRDFLSAIGGLGGADATERARIDRARALAAEIDAQIATLVLTVDPPGATVEVDGDETSGAGAVRTLELDPGRHAITVRAAGRDPSSFTVALLSGTRSAERVTLPESSATRLIVESGDAAARIEVDGAVVGTGRVESPIAGGRHVVRVVPPTGEARQREIEITPGTTLTVDLAGGAAAGGVESEPWFWLVVVGATLVVGGVVTGVVAATYDPGVEAPLPGQVPPGGVIAALRF
jgi:hypothetical protein